MCGGKSDVMARRQWPGHRRATRCPARAQGFTRADRTLCQRGRHLESDGAVCRSTDAWL